MRGTIASSSAGSGDAAGSGHSGAYRQINISRPRSYRTKTEKQGRLKILITPLLAAATLFCSEKTAPEVPSVASRIEVFEGVDQVAAANTEVLLSVRVTDDAKRPVPGAKVFWTLEVGGGTVTPESFTDGSGIASAVRLLGSDAGVNRTKATLDHPDRPSVSLASISLVQGATQMELAGANTQSDTVMANVAYQVVVRNHTGARVQGVSVQWRLLTNSGTLAASATTSDANGLGAVVHRLGLLIGVVRAEAYVDGLQGSPIRFTTNVAPGRLASLVGIDGNNQIGALSTDLPASYAVRAADAYGNILFPTVLWSVLSGGGSVTPVSGPFTRHRLGPTEGPQSVLATVQNRSDLQLVFTSTAVSALVSLIVRFDLLQSRAFAPDTIRIPAGRTVAWRWQPTNCDPYFYYCSFEDHNVTFEDQPAQPPSSPTQSTGTHMRMFDAPGTYRYRCTIHSTDFEHGMVGRIIVN